ncbi:MAG: hypothetical protein LC772_01835 [Chloroflexi bacterium]|nr:hypothetical protein [Chloroflexota bacterium]
MEKSVISGWADVSRGVPDEDLNAIYNYFDVFVLASQRRGLRPAHAGGNERRPRSLAVDLNEIQENLFILVVCCSQRGRGFPEDDGC